MFKRTLALTGLLAGSSLLHAQASATASRSGQVIVGGGYSRAASDYGVRFTGYNIFGDFNFTRHLGLEATFRTNKAPSPSPLYERTYQIGGRYSRTYGIFVPYGKLSYGRGIFNYPPCPGGPRDKACANLAFNMFALAGGADVMLRPWLSVRAEYEFQDWPGFRGTVGGPANGLTPRVFSLGGAYHFR